MDGTRIAGPGQAAVQVSSRALLDRAGAARRFLARTIPVATTLAAAAAAFSWIVAAVGVVPMVSGLAVCGALLSVLIAWSLVKA
jgi:hypothetical protein